MPVASGVLISAGLSGLAPVRSAESVDRPSPAFASDRPGRHPGRSVPVFGAGSGSGGSGEIPGPGRGHGFPISGPTDASGPGRKGRADGPRPTRGWPRAETRSDPIDCGKAIPREGANCAFSVFRKLRWNERPESKTQLVALLGMSAPKAPHGRSGRPRSGPPDGTFHGGRFSERLGPSGGSSGTRSPQAGNTGGIGIGGRVRRSDVVRVFFGRGSKAKILSRFCFRRATSRRRPGSDGSGTAPTMDRANRLRAVPDELWKGRRI